MISDGVPIIGNEWYKFGAYVGNDIDYVKNVSSSFNCKLTCQNLNTCYYWTFVPILQECWRHNASAPIKTSFECNGCTRGPRNLEGADNNEITFLYSIRK